MKYSFYIPDTYRNERLDQVLAKLLPDYSRTQIQAWLANGSILINGLAAKGKAKIKGDETVEVNITIEKSEQWQAQDIPLNIVHEDNSLIIINKPVGLVVHPGAGVPDNTLLNALLHHDPNLATLPRAGILHRLDKDTSGLLLVAKTQQALTHLGKQLKKRELLREYQAIVTGRLISGGTINAPIDRHPTQRKRMAVVETGRPATTHYRVAEKFRAHTLLTVKLETGRTHQIRVHMMYIRHPVVGDVTYGAKPIMAKGLSPELITVLKQFKRQALHAFALGFKHPETNEFVRFQIDLPTDFAELITALKKDTHEKKS